MKKALILLALIFSLKTYSQSNPEKELGAWYMYGGSHQISNKIKIKSLAHFRFFDFGGDLQQLLLRAGVNYKLGDNMGILAGYAYLNTDSTFDLDGGDASEHRIYEDFYLSNKISKLGLAHRVRLEHRFFETDTQHWIRYQLGVSHPIDDKWSTYLYDEIFLNFQGDTYAQNWLGFGFKYKLSSSTKLQLGYQQISVNGGGNFDRILVGVAISTDHRKKK